MMRHAYAASAVLALAGTAHAFVVHQFQIQPNESIEPSSGGFWNYEFGAFVSGNLVTGTRNTWVNYDALLQQTTWLAIDRAGGGGNFSATLTGPGPDPDVPEWNRDTTSQLGGGVRMLDASGYIATGLDGGPEGYVWGYDPVSPFAATSAVSPVNGITKDSIFVGNFALTDEDAVLVGAPLLVTIDGADHLLALSGAPDAFGYRIEYERYSTDYSFDGTSLRAFVVIPAPGPAALLASIGLALRRRRART